MAPILLAAEQLVFCQSAPPFVDMNTPLGRLPVLVITATKLGLSGAMATSHAGKVAPAAVR